MDISEWKELTRRARSALLGARDDEARHLYEMALGLAEHLGNEVVLGVSLNNLAVLYSRRGEYEEAEKYYCRAYDIEYPAGEPTGLLRSLQNNAAVNLHRQGHVIEARPLYFQSISDNFAPHRFADSWVAPLTNFSHLQMEQGKLTQAESLLKRARQSIERLPVREKVCESHLKFANAQLSLQQGRLFKAETDFAEMSSGDEDHGLILTALSQVGLARVMHRQIAKIADLELKHVAEEKQYRSGALLSDALGTLLEHKGAGSLEYLDAALAYVDHLCLASQWEEAEIWIQRLRAWLELLGQGIHPWNFALLEQHERVCKHLKKKDEALEIAQRIVELRFLAKSIHQQTGDDDEPQ